MIGVTYGYLRQRWPEVAPCYVFLASNDSSYMTGRVFHPNGGRTVNGRSVAKRILWLLDTY